MRGTKAKAIRKIAGGNKSRARVLKKFYDSGPTEKALINGAIEVFGSR